MLERDVDAVKITEEKDAWYTTDPLSNISGLNI